MEKSEEIRARIAQGINQEFNRMVDSGAITGVPKIPDVVTPPAAPTAPAPVAPVAPVVPATTAEATPKVEPATTTGKVFNKYTNLEEAEKGYFNAVNTLSATLDESAKKDEEIARLRSQVTAPRADQDRPRVNPVARNPVDLVKKDAVIKTSEASGVPVEVLAEFAAEILADANAGAKQTLSDTLAPMSAIAEAQTYMQQTYPDALNHTKEVENFIKSNPRVRETVGALIRANDPKAAMEYAWVNYTIETGIGIETKMKANAEVAEAERTAARAAAGLPSSPTTPVHSVTAGPAQPTAEEIAFLKEKAKGGDELAGKLLRRIALGHLLPAHLRTWENPQ